MARGCCCLRCWWFGSMSTNSSNSRSKDISRKHVQQQQTTTATHGRECCQRRRRKQARILCRLFLVLLAIVYASLLWVGTNIQKQLMLLPYNNNNNNSNYKNNIGNQFSAMSTTERYSLPTHQEENSRQQQEQQHVTATDASVVVSKEEQPEQVQDQQQQPHNLWDDPSSQLPLWMKDYFTWHQQQRALLNSTNWKKFRYLIMQCREHDTRCGGTADRLKPMPYIVLMAAQTQRLLFIKWERPHALEEFLVPPQGGIDWRTPDFLPSQLWTRNHNRPAVSHRGMLKMIQERPKASCLCTKLQSSGNEYYDSKRRLRRPTATTTTTTTSSSSSSSSSKHNNSSNADNNDGDDYSDMEEPTFAQVYPEVWRIMFTPSPPIAQLIVQQMHQLQLQPQSYVAAHIRSSYGKLAQENYRSVLAHYLQRWSKASLLCALQILPNAPILAVSDSLDAINMTLTYATSLSLAGSSLPKVVARLAPPSMMTVPRDHSINVNPTFPLDATSLLLKQQKQQKQSTPLHLEKSNEWQQHPASDYYDTFVDLYLMAMARCVVYNVGGFGHWAMLIGAWNVSACGLQYFDIFQGFHSCAKQGKKVSVSSLLSSSSFASTTPQQRSSSPLFLPPMKESNGGITISQASQGFKPRYFPRPIGDAFQILLSERDASPLTTLAVNDLLGTDAEISKEANEPLSKGLTRTSKRLHLHHHPLKARATNNNTLNSTSFPWEESRILPDWIKEYFRWHRMQRANITMDNWRDYKYMVVRCRKSRRCGGTADRLKPIPFYVLIAYRTKRILMINWERPKPLEDFLVPPIHGLDWRVPDYLVWNIARDNYPKHTLERIERAMNDTVARTLTVRYQSHSSGSDYYDQNRPGGPTFAAVFREVWQTFFTPAPPIAKRIEDQMAKFGLVPGQYVAAHVRSNYTTDPQRQDLEIWTQNAINCASQLMPSTTTFFASDSSVAVDIATAYAAERNARVVVRSHDTPPLHLEKALDWESRPASDYYDTFVDLYLLGMSRCVTYNQGGYGHWASLISFNSSCSIQHHHANGEVETCEWKTIQGNPDTQQSLQLQRPLFADPMPIPNLWDTATKIPPWMKEYFAWHAEQVANLNEDNWESQRYLIIVCLKENIQCGGVSDRLKPLPVLLLVAYRTERLLMIWWERPCDLEEFMVPPKGGLDWRVPAWLRPQVMQEGNLVSHLQALTSDAPEPISVLRVLYQSGNAGSVYFNQTEDSQSSYEEVFHDLFRIAFTPSPALAEVIEDTMKRNKLTAGEYASAHLRAMYGRTYRDPAEVKFLAINAAMCASKLRPGGPVFFAGDSKLAVDAVRAFATKKSLPVVTHEYEGEALHLDKDSRNETVSFKPADFFPTFVDLYLLAQSNCVAYSNGGFGTFGLMISYNSSCSFRHFRRRRQTQNCRWQSRPTTK